MTILQEPYHRGRLFVFVLHPRLRLIVVIAYFSFFAAAVVRALVEGRDVLSTLDHGLWITFGVFLFFPLWNRFIVYPWAKDRPKKDRIGFLAFFEVLPLVFGTWLMLASLLWGDVTSN